MSRIRALRAACAVAAIAVLIGAFARADALERKVVWVDETFSLLRISGHSQEAFFALFDGRTHAPAELLALEHVDSARPLAATLASLREEPQRGPLYYVLARGWIAAFGERVAAMRSFSVILGIAGIAIAFFLGRRMSGGVSGGAVLAALVALSPIQIRFSQQIREYVLVADLTLLAAFLLLRALDRPTPLRWSVYALTLVLCVLTNPTLAALACAYGVVALVSAYRTRSRARAFGGVAAPLGAGVLLLPWALSLVHESARGAGGVSWAATGYDLRATALKAVFDLGATFFDSTFAYRPAAVVLIPGLAFVAFALVGTFRAVERPEARDVTLATLLALLAPLVALDALQCAHFATVVRYEMPTWIGAEMLLAGCIATGIAAGGKRAGPALAAFAYLVGCGTAAALLDRGYDEWWDNNDHLSERAVGARLAAVGRPVTIVADDARADAYDAFVLARYLPADARLLLHRGTPPPLTRALACSGSVYLFTPSEDVRRALAGPAALVRAENVSPASPLKIPDLQMRGDDPVRADNALWQLVPKAAPCR